MHTAVANPGAVALVALETPVAGRQGVVHRPAEGAATEHPGPVSPLPEDVQAVAMVGRVDPEICRGRGHAGRWRSTAASTTSTSATTTSSAATSSRHRTQGIDE